MQEVYKADNKTIRLVLSKGTRPDQASPYAGSLQGRQQDHQTGLSKGTRPDQASPYAGRYLRPIRIHMLWRPVLIFVAGVNRTKRPCPRIIVVRRSSCTRNT